MIIMRSTVTTTLVVLLSIPLIILCQGGRPMMGARDEDVANKYLRHYGYLVGEGSTELKSALLLLQTNMGLPPTGTLDTATATAIRQPRCGVPDMNATAITTSRRFSYFSGQPHWENRTTLSYAFTPGHAIPNRTFSPAKVRTAFARSFARWSAVVPLNFSLSTDYSTADIKIGFHRGEHGDGQPFDGILGVLAHAFSPQNGRFHLDADEWWALDNHLGSTKSSAIHLESVVTHEIGHVLGLGHSSVQDAVMYPSLTPGTTKLRLHNDDVRGVQALYGSNPNFSLTSDTDTDINYQHQSISTDTNTTQRSLSFFLLLLLLFTLFP